MAKKQGKQQNTKKAPASGPAPVGKVEPPALSTHIRKESDLPLPIPPPHSPRVVSFQATVPTIHVQSPSAASKSVSPQAIGHYKPLRESQQATAQWGNEPDGQWDGVDNGGGEWGSPQHGGADSIEANRWSQASGQEEDGGEFDRSEDAWDHGGQDASHAQSGAVPGDWTDSGSGMAGGGVVSGWGDQNTPATQSQRAVGSPNTAAARVKSPHPPTPSPAPPPPPTAPSADPSGDNIPHPRTIKSTRAVYPPSKTSNTGGKDDNWGTALADSADVLQENSALQTWSGAPHPAADWGAHHTEMKGGAMHPGVSSLPMSHTPGAWMLWQKEANRNKVLVQNDPRAPIPAFPLTSHPSAGGGGGGRPELTPGQRAQMLNNLLTDPTRQGHAKQGAAWGVPMMNGQKQQGGHQRGHSVYEQHGGGGGAWGAAPQWSGDPSSSKHAKHRSAGHQQPQQMQPAGSWDAWGGAGGGGDTWGNEWSGGGGNKDPGGWGNGAQNGSAWGDIREEEDGWEEEEEWEEDGEYDDEDDGYEDDGWGDSKHKKHRDDYDAWGGGGHHKDKGKGRQTPGATPHGHHGNLHGHTPGMQGQPLPYDPKLSKTMNIAYGRHDAMAAAAAAAEAQNTAKAPHTPVAPSLPTILPPAHERHIIDAKGSAVKPASKALYSRRRPPKERIHWKFNPDKDERVYALLDWVGAMSTELAVFGLHKFMQDGQRGALFTNADIRVGSGLPTFDWITIDRLQLTLDRILQESVIAYNPMLHVVVFVFLLSHSGNSMAIWRKKVPIPEHIRSARKEEIQAIIDQLDPKYRVLVDELDPPEPPKKKRGFWRKLFGLR